MPITAKHVLKRAKKMGININYARCYFGGHVFFYERFIMCVFVNGSTLYYTVSGKCKTKYCSGKLNEDNLWQNTHADFLIFALSQPKIERYMNAKIRRLWILRLILVILK